MSVTVDLSILDEPLHEDDWEYLRDNAPQYLDRVEKALRQGATPEQVFQHYMRLAPHRYALWLRVKHAAMHLQERRQ
jgi:transcriptional regulator GlxA family with amidase domain